MGMPWTVVLFPQAEAELRQLPATERAAVLNAAKKLEALGPDLGYRIPALFATPIVSGSCGLAEGGRPDGRSTVGWAMCSPWRRWGRRPMLTRGASRGRSLRRRIDWRRWRTDEAQ